MKIRLSLRLILVPLLLAATAAPAAAPKPTKDDIARLVTEAATYEPGQSREALQRLEEIVRQPSSSVRKHLEAGLVQLLGPSSTFEARRFACKELGIIGSKKALPELAKLLRSDETVGIACLALTTYPEGKADDILRETLTSAAGSAQIQIITTVGDRRDRKAVKQLTALAGDSDESVARAAIAALGKIGDKAAWQTLVALPNGKQSALQPAVTEATLRYAGSRAAAGDLKAALPLYEQVLAGSQPVYVRRAAFEALLRLDKANAEQRILDVLRGSDTELKPAAIAAVRWVSAPNASDTFAGELPKLSPEEQVWMIGSLAARGDAAASAAIGNCVASPEAIVRNEAIVALGRMGGPWCVGLFARALDHSKTAQERSTVESALIDLPGEWQTDRTITTALKAAAGNTRATLIAALARREGPSANLLLLAEARGSDVPAATAALRALAKTATAQDVGPLLERLTSTRDPQIRMEAENAVAQTIPRVENVGRRSRLVRDALRWAQPQESRVALIGLLPACGDDAALLALKAAAASRESDIRDAAVRALADWPDDSAWDALAGIYQRPPTEIARTTALRGLVRLAAEQNAHPSAQLVARYRMLLKGSHNDSDLRLILGALGGAIQPGALELALPLLDRSEVRAEAEVAVKKIAKAIKAQNPKAAQEALERLKEKQ